MVAMLASCENDLPLYHESQNRLMFNFPNPADSVMHYSFVYDNTLQQDTVWVKMKTIGFVSDHDRAFQLEQEATDENDARPGVHYQDFATESLKRFYVIPAGKVEARVPVVLLRDASLKQAEYTLRMRVKPTAEFGEGYPDKAVRTLYIADFLSKPQAWAATATWLFGEYGTVKHQFLIDATGKKWDDDYLNNELKLSGEYTLDYMIYFEGVLRRKLDSVNADRAAQGLGKLCEADGTEVTIPLVTAN